VTEITN